MNNDEIGPEVLDRYLAGDCSPDERAQVDAWLARDPSIADRLSRFRRAIEPGAPGTWDVEAAWQRFDRRRSEPLEAIRSSSLSERSPVPGILLRAAILAAVLFGGMAVWRAAGRRSAGPARAMAAVTLAGQRDTVLLADGSTVILAPDSRLEIIDPADGTRSVELSGEAYFSVMTDPDRPFRVRAGESVTEVLGTGFNVRARGGAEPVVVAVRSGRVTFGRSSGDGERIVLESGDVGRLGPAGGPEREAGADSGQWLAWLDGVLEFDGAPLDHVLAEFARWFGVEIRLGDAALGARRVSGRFATGTPELALDALVLTLDLGWERSESGYVVNDGAGR